MVEIIKSYIENIVNNEGTVIVSGGFPISEIVNLENKKRAMLGGSTIGVELLNTLDGLVVPNGLMVGDYMVGGKRTHIENPPQLIGEEMFEKLFNKVAISRKVNNLSKKRGVKVIRGTRRK